MLLRIKKRLRLVIAVLATLPLLAFQIPTGFAEQSTVSTAAPQLQATSAVLMDLDTGQLLYEKNPNTHLYPASITKIMTALLALKYGRLKDRIATSAYAASQEPNKVYLVPGEVESLKQMLYGLLIDSGNDAAVAIAEHYGHSVQGFARMMNEEARELGARNTHFVNPNGLHDPNHYTSAYDMALIAREAMKIPEFRQIVDTKYYLWRGKEWTSLLSNLNQMLWWYPGANGVKTGWTDQAEQTIVVTATRNHMTLLAVLMHVNGLYTVQEEAGSLLDFGFANFHEGLLVPKGTVVKRMKVEGHVIPLATTVPIYGAVRNGTHDHQIGLTASTGFQVRIHHIHPGILAQTPVGSVSFLINQAHLDSPVGTTKAIPLPPTRKLRPPLWPVATATALCFIAWVWSRRRTKVWYKAQVVVGSTRT